MAERRPKNAGLQRALGTTALFSTAYGNVGSSIYYALGLVAAFALGLTPVAFIISGIIFAMTAATYSEATVMYPEAGGSSSFARHAFNEFISFVAAWGQMLNYIITVAISAFFVPHYLRIFWAPLENSPWDIIGGAVVIGFLVIVNIVGVKESARVNVVLAIADFMTQVLLAALGLVLVFSPDILINNVHLGIAPTWSNFVLGIAVGMIAYTGIETISNMAEEAKDAGKTIPRSAGLVVLAVTFLYILLPTIALSAMPVVESGGSFHTVLATDFKDDPVLGIVENMPLGPFLHAAQMYVGVLAAVILIIATNAGLIGVSRLTYSMGLHRQVPDKLRKVHPKFRTPYIALIIFGGVAVLTTLPGQSDFLGTMYAFGAMLSFTIAHLSVVVLRVRHPNSERPWRVPFNVGIAGYSIPLPAVIGGLGTLGAWIAVMVLYKATLLVGSIWMVAGITLYVVFRRQQGLSLSATEKVQLPPPVVEKEVEYRSVVVVVDNLFYTRQSVLTAAKLASRKRRGVHVMVTITVPLNLPMNARLEAQEAQAHALVEDARFVGGRLVTGEIIKVRPGQAGTRICLVAADMRAEAIVIPLQNKGGSLFSKTAEALLERRPCRIIVDSEAVGRAANAA